MNKKLILIAEDDPFIRKLFLLNLQQEDWDVVSVINGQEAIDFIEATPPDVVLLDLLMPKVDGFGVLQHLDTHNSSVPVIILSNLSQEIDEVKAREMGAVAFFVKSNVDVDDLQQMMNIILTGQ